MVYEKDYQLAESGAAPESPRSPGNDADSDHLEEYMFDAEEIAGAAGGNASTRRKKFLKGLMYVAIFTVFMLGVSAGVVLVFRMLGIEQSGDDAAEDTPPPGDDGGSNDNNSTQPAQVFSYNVLSSYYHDPDEFTQGFFWHNGYIYESDGLRGQSNIRYYELDSQDNVQRTPLNPTFFGEGCTMVNGTVLQLTWEAGKGFKYDSENLELVENWHYKGEGWGITTGENEEVLYMSDGTDEIRRLDPITLKETAERLKVQDADGTYLDQLNELEFIDGEIWANVWQTDTVLRINPDTGRVNSKVDFAGLLKEEDRIEGEQVDVLNGIAYDKEQNKIYVTGKLWPKIYHVEIV